MAQEAQAVAEQPTEAEKLLLSNHSVDQLADLRQGEARRESIRTTLEAVSGKGTIEKVFLPQFVLQ